MINSPNGKEAADKVADGAIAAAYSALSMGYAAHLMNRPGAPASPAAACASIILEGVTIQSVVCSVGNHQKTSVLEFKMCYKECECEDQKQLNWLL